MMPTLPGDENEDNFDDENDELRHPRMDSDILIVDDKRMQEDFDNKAYQTKDPSKFPD